MAELGFEFDANSVPEPDEYKPIPAGKYVAIATESEWKQSKSDPESEYLQYTFLIMEGERKDETVRWRLSMKSKNETARQISQRKFAEFCLAVGVPKPTKTEELHDKKCVIHLTVEARKDKPGSYSNEIKKVEACQNTSSRPAVPPSAPTPGSSPFAPRRTGS